MGDTLRAVNSVSPVQRTELLNLGADALRAMVDEMLNHGDLPRPWRSSDGDERCQECMQVNPVWWIQNQLWNSVMDGDRGAILCPSCFIQRAERAGYGKHGAWQLYPPSPLR